jgi:hypothetical protein
MIENPNQSSKTNPEKMKTTLLLKTTALFTAILVSITSFTQIVPELVFSNPVLISGQAGQNGAKYRFPNVISGPNALDAIVQIKGRSSSSVILKNIDNSSDGWNKAFQPELGINGSISPNAHWWMEFRMEFVEAGTNNKKKIDKFVITSLDVDGDGNTVREWIQMKKVKTLTTSTTNYLVTNLLNLITDLLDFNNSGCDAEILGPTRNFSSIDTSATAVMATYEYEEKDRIEFRLGGKKSNSHASAAGMRMNSLWFKQFSLEPPLTTLPVKLIDFNASLKQSNVDLTWTTAGEENSSHFDIERSLDGSNYNSVGIVFSNGNTNEIKKYSFSNDVRNLQSTAIYYRLKAVDIDGYVEYSDVRIIRLQSKDVLAMSMFPNPAVNEVRVTLPSNWQGKDVRFAIYNQSGVEVSKLARTNASQTETIQVDRLVKGFYIIKASCGIETAQQKLLKN